MADATPPRIALAPDSSPRWMAEAIVAGGAQLTSLSEAEALMWGDPHAPEALAEALQAAPGVFWVQLPFAGIENFLPLVDTDRLWTCGKGVYAEPVAEMALALGLAGLRSLHRYARAGDWTDPAGRNLLGARVAVLGGGGITTSLVRLLEPFRCHITVVRRRDEPFPGAHEVVPADRYRDVLPDADLVVLALPLTPQTHGLIGRRELELMAPGAWLVNVARGGHVVTDDLVDALRAAAIGGAGLDVTDPEPLPADHPLWKLENCIITPHVGNTPDMARPLLAERITTNVRRFVAGEELVGVVDTDAGY